ncbi:hypothetical protein INT45_001438 [Circinella minor]|uniref:Uncharacterized protein n=1 Tax=Circinella minor TaxID=1195481 RepID=A0A8H7RTN9_9FUNG|nr:hypothetical protein INT45_001438 [Circinella minor]
MQQQEDHPLRRLEQMTGSVASAPTLGRTGGTTTPDVPASNEATTNPPTAADPNFQATIQGLQDHVTTTDGHFHGIRYELSETSARLVALDDANDRMVSQLQESTTTFANMEQRLGNAMGSADSNFAATIQQLRDDAARQAQAHEQQMQQLHEMFIRLSSQLVDSQATPQPPPSQTATTSAPSQQPPQPSSSSAPPPPPPNNVPQAGAKPEVKNDVTGSWASIHATLP